MSIPRVEARRFSVGKYDIIATPMPNSAHMLRYTVFLKGRRIGATMSVPSEADCRFIEAPPPTPPLVPYQNIYRPGRPKKGTPPRTYDQGAAAAPREELPQEISIPLARDER
jgi:hypothetical protein